MKIEKESYLNRLKHQIENANLPEIEHAINLIECAWRSGKQIITMGNGGSSLTALHFINDWNKSIYLKTRIPFRGRTLVDNIGLVFSYSNDISFENVFVEQLKNIMSEGDLIVGISGSGNSKNVIRAIDYANKNGGITLGLCGFDGGELRLIAQHSYWVNVNDMQITEDMHMIFGHMVMQKICNHV